MISMIGCRPSAKSTADRFDSARYCSPRHIRTRLNRRIRSPLYDHLSGLPQSRPFAETIPTSTPAERPNPTSYSQGLRAFTHQNLIFGNGPFASTSVETLTSRQRSASCARVVSA